MYTYLKKNFRFYPNLHHLLSGLNFRKSLLSESLNHMRKCDQILNFGECYNIYIYVCRCVCVCHISITQYVFQVKKNDMAYILL